MMSFFVQKILQPVLKGGDGRLLLLDRLYCRRFDGGPIWFGDLFQGGPYFGLLRSRGDWETVLFENAVCHQFEGERVRRAVFHEEIPCMWGVERLPLLPELDGVITVGALQILWADDAEHLFDGFQATREVESLAKPSEVDVRDGQGREVEESRDFRNVECAAVVGDDKWEGKEKVRKVIDVFIFNEQLDLMLVENGYDGDIRVKIESGSFDVEEGALWPMLVEKPPSILRGKMFDEELDVVCGIRLTAFDGCLVDWRPEGVPGMEFRRREGADVFPRTNAGLQQHFQTDGADVRKMREGLPERRYVWMGIGHVSFSAIIPLSNVMASHEKTRWMVKSCRDGIIDFFKRWAMLWFHC